MANNNDLIKNMARKQARQLLSNSSFFSLGQNEQMELYKDVYGQAYNQLLAEQKEADKLAMGMRGTKPRTAGEMIDPEAHRSKRIEQAGELAGEFIREVNFPQFVSDLLKGVFDANLEVTLKQMETYKDLLKSASASVSKFVKEIDNTAAFGYLAENQSDDFNLDFDDDNNAVLKDKDGNVVAAEGQDIGDNEVKAKIMDAKIAMAQEHRALLREMILMGVTRLVVEKGTVKASVLFDLKASEKIRRADKAGMRESQSVTRHLGGGFLGFIGGGRTATSQKSQVSVSSVKSEADASLAAKMAGSVEIIFKSDYFKLDNFAAMYAPQLAAAGAGGGAGGGAAGGTGAAPAPAK